MQKNQHCDVHLSCIAHVPIFDSLSREDRLRIAATATSRTYTKGETVYRAGDEGGKLYVLYTGQAKVYRLNPNGREQVIRTVEPGDFVGELSLFSTLPLSDNLQVTKNTLMCMLSGPTVKDIMKTNPNIAFKVMDELSRRLEKAETRIEAISLGSVTQRVAKALLDLAAEQDSITLAITKGDWASQLGMSQETLSRRLSSLQEEGLIALEGLRGIRLLDKDELEALSNE